MPAEISTEKSPLRALRTKITGRAGSSRTSIYLALERTALTAVEELDARLRSRLFDGGAQ